MCLTSDEYQPILSKLASKLWYPRAIGHNQLGGLQVKATTTPLRRVMSIAAGIALGIALGGVISMFILVLILI